MKASEIDGWMSQPEIDWLTQQASLCQHVVELGVWKGRSTYALAEGVKGIVLAVDHFLGSEAERGESGGHRDASTPAGSAKVKDEFLNNVAEFINSGKVKLVQADIAEAFAIVRPMLPHAGADMIFIDGDHQEHAVERDIKNYLPLVRSSGILCGHDIDYVSVCRPVEKLLPCWRHGPGSIWWWRKP